MEIIYEEIGLSGRLDMKGKRKIKIKRNERMREREVVCMSERKK